MSSEWYTVSNSQIVAEQFRSVLREAEHRGILVQTLEAMKWIIGELQRTPNEYGESRELFERAQLQARIGFAGKLCVEFAVHEASRTVFIRSCHLV